MSPTVRIRIFHAQPLSGRNAGRRRRYNLDATSQTFHTGAVGALSWLFREPRCIDAYTGSRGSGVPSRHRLYCNQGRHALAATQQSVLPAEVAAVLRTAGGLDSAAR
jgi:hypothetical protein